MQLSFYCMWDIDNCATVTTWLGGSEGVLSANKEATLDPWSFTFTIQHA